MPSRAIVSPPYFNRNFSHDVSSTASAPCKSLASRVALAALPFFTLYKPFSYPIALAMGSVRLITGAQTLFDGERSRLQCAHVAAAAAGLAGTLFGHPLGILIASAHDLLLNCKRLADSLHEGEYKRSVGELFHAINELLYITLFLGAGAEVTAASLCVQFLLGIHRSRAHLQKGEKIEGVSHLLMSLIRGHLAIRKFQEICTQKEIQKAKQEGKPYLPLANRVQLFFTNMGYRINGLARWTIRQINHCLKPAQNSFSQLQTAAKVAVVTPFVLASFLFSVPCYLAASYAGIGRFERIEAANPSSAEPTGSLRIQFQNICGQNPWSLFTSGYAPPFEEGPDGKRRVDAVLEQILEENPDVYCGQEYDDLDTSRFIGENLARNGYTCVRDVGCSDPFFNHSGLFIASKSSETMQSVGFIPIAPEHTSGITYGCNRGLLIADVPMADGSPLRIVNIHLNAGSTLENQTSRLEQFHHYVAPAIEGQRALIVGDSNLDTAALSDEQRKEAGLLGLTNALEGQVTCSDEAKHTTNGKSRAGCADCEEKIDVAIFDPKEINVSDLKIEPGNSDHHAISLTVAVTRSP